MSPENVSDGDSIQCSGSNVRVTISIRGFMFNREHKQVWDIFCRKRTIVASGVLLLDTTDGLSVKTGKTGRKENHSSPKQ